MKRRLLVKVLMLPVMLAGYLLISGVPAVAQSESCSNRTLVGDYGFTIEGTLLDASAPFRGLALQHYDGRGHISRRLIMWSSAATRRPRSGRPVPGPTQ